jgi:hypothetical protein
MDPTRISPATPLGSSAALDAALAPGERVTHLVPAIGCTLALTSDGLIIAREGSTFRPKTGIRRWDLDDRLAIRAGLVRQGSGSLVILWDRDATSVFVRAEHWDAALELVGAVRASIRRVERARK